MPRLRLELTALLPLLLAGLIAVIAAGTTDAPAAAPAAPPPPAISDTGILTEYALPPNRNPWELQWDAARNWIWFAEGNHSNPALDQIGAIDVSTSILREWGVPTANAGIHGTVLDGNGDLWFTEHEGNRLGRLHVATNTITEWDLPGMSQPHAITVDDSNLSDITIWMSEREVDVITSFKPATGVFQRHTAPIVGSQPHGIVVDPDHSLWIVDTCDHQVGHLVFGAADQWTLWQPPPGIFPCGPPHVGPLFDALDNGKLWYSEPEQARLLRLDPATNTFNIWQAPGAGTGFESAELTQIGLDPSGNVFYSAMRGNTIGRLEPNGGTAPTVVAVAPVLTAQPTPATGQATAAAVVYTPIVTQLTPNPRTSMGTRTGGITEWPLSTSTPVPGLIGPARAWYGGGSFWVAERDADLVAGFAPATDTPGPSPTPTTPPPTATPAPSDTPTASFTPRPSDTPGPSPTPCSVSFSDVFPTDYFYTPVQYLACRGVVSGYADGTFRPYNNTTRAQMVKIVVLGFGIPITTPLPGDYTFADVPPDFPFFAVIETAAVNNIVSGYTCGGEGEPCDPFNRPYFRPFANVTRGQLAKIVVVAAGWPLQNPPVGTFEDVFPGSAFYQFVETAYCESIISGYSCGGPGEPCDPSHRPYFRPSANSTRGQIAKIVYGALTGPGVCTAPAP